jgi:diamine N-acetyltransferase
MITLSPITFKNWRVAAALEVHPNQASFLPPVIVAIVETQFFPLAKQFLILFGGKAVGDAQIGEDVETGNQKIFRLMIDKSHQRQGIGKAAVQELLKLQFGNAGCNSVTPPLSLKN